MKKTSLVILVILLGIYATAQVNLSQSLTACYALNANATEPINALNGVLSAVTPTIDRFNNPSSALAFNGSTLSYIELPDSPLLKPTSGISFSGWVRVNNTNAQYILFTRNPLTSNFEAYEVSITTVGGPKFRVRKNNGASVNFVDGTTAVLPNTWYHIAATIDNLALKIYVNGNLEATTSINATFNYLAGKKVYLGGSNEASYNIPFNGSMDNIRIYNRVINASEVNQLYLTDPTCSGGPAPIASFSVSANTVCVGQALTLTDLSANTPTAWAWQMNGGTPNSSSVTNPTVSYATAGTYSISLTSTNAFGSSIPTTQTVTVNPLPLVTASTGNTFICNGSSAVLVANGANTYTWNTSQVFQAINVSPTVTTTYVVTGTGNNGCINTASVTVAVDNCTSLKQNNINSSLIVYPNPNSGKFTIANSEDAKEILLYNLLGELILKTEIKTGEALQIDISNKANGIYFLKLKINGEQIIRKLVKE